MPPALGYYTLEGPFAAPELHGVTKRLVFSAWQHGSARRRIPSFIRSGAPDDACGHPARAIDARRLEKAARTFALREYQTTAGQACPCFCSFIPVSPSAATATRAHLARSARLTAAEVRAQFHHPCDKARSKSWRSRRTRTSGTDDRWYWLAPMLL